MNTFFVKWIVYVCDLKAGLAMPIFGQNHFVNLLGAIDLDCHHDSLVVYN